MNHRQTTTLWSTLIVEEFVRHGITLFCISPGSRSTPLTIAAARHAKTECIMFPDERAGGFFALGYAKSTGKPAVLVCTSGTAVANYYPAVVEASSDNRPMLLLTADRPFELIDAEANQTIRQPGIFGAYTRWNVQLPEPSTAIPARSLLSTIDHAVASSMGEVPGPVHINAPFREPLEPVELPGEDPWLLQLEAWRKNSAPLCISSQPDRLPPEDSVQRVRKLLERSSSTFILAGQLDSPEEAEAVLELAKGIGAPIYADISSQIRFHPEYLPLQHLMLSEEFMDRFRPDTVIHFGGKIVGKLPGVAIRRWKPEHVVVVKNHPKRFDPDHNVTMSIQSAPGAFARALANRTRAGVSHALALEAVCRETRMEIDRLCSPDAPVTEISAASILSGKLPRKSALFLANSMPVRDMDNYAANLNDSRPLTGVNRGASGIDGNIATAAGFARGLRQPVTLLIGDLSFLHDLNSLTLLRDLRHPLRIIVNNNNGGGIFSFLPIAGQTDVFETHFGTPQHFCIRSAAETFGLAYDNPSTNAGFASSYADLCRSGQPGIIEITGSRANNLAEHRRLNARIRTIVDRHLCG